MSGPAPSGINYSSLQGKGGAAWSPAGNAGSPMTPTTNMPTMNPVRPTSPLTPAARPNIGPINMGNFNPQAFSNSLNTGKWGSLNPNILRGMMR